MFRVLSLSAGSASVFVPENYGTEGYVLPVRAHVQDAVAVHAVCQDGEFRDKVASAPVRDGKAFLDIPLLMLPRRATILVYAARLHEEWRSIASLEYERTTPCVPADLTFSPILVNTLGRTGSSMLMGLLSHHPEVFCYVRFPFELHVSQWFYQLMRLAATPAYREDCDPNRVLGADCLSRNPYLMSRDELTFPGLAGPAVDAVIAGALRAIDAVYAHAASARMGGQLARATRFAEKWSAALPRQTVLLRELYPDGYEIVLVRDPRDMLASMVAVNSRRKPSFGRQLAKDDIQWVNHLARALAGTVREWRRDQERKVLLRYEQLALHPDDTLTGLLQALGLRSDASTVRVILDQANADSLAHVGHRTTVSPQESIGRWKTDLPEPLRSHAEKAFHDTIVQLGYQE